jgi:hypothetical protein
VRKLSEEQQLKLDVEMPEMWEHMTDENAPIIRCAFWFGYLRGNDHAREGTPLKLAYEIGVPCGDST